MLMRFLQRNPKTTSDESRNLSGDDNGKTIQVKRGTMLYYEASFGTSAYQWRDPIVTGTALQYQGIHWPINPNPTRPASPPKLGSTNWGSFTFQATSKGTSTIELRQGYLQNEEESDLIFGITVVVK
jgi:hypothetical protein